VSARELAAPAPRITLRPAEAAAALGVSLDLFNEKIAPQLRQVRFAAESGRRTLKLYPVRELERWVESEATRLPE
jgi:hypothetical protein